MPVLPADPTQPALGLWYEEPGLEQRAAPSPDAETKALLEGFGYL